MEYIADELPVIVRRSMSGDTPNQNNNKNPTSNTKIQTGPGN
jgi:hypothetical protein